MSNMGCPRPCHPQPLFLEQSPRRQPRRANLRDTGCPAPSPVPVLPHSPHQSFLAQQAAGRGRHTPRGWPPPGGRPCGCQGASWPP